MDLAGPDVGDPGIVTDVPAGDPGVPTDLTGRDLEADETPTGGDEGQDTGRPEDLPSDPGTDGPHPEDLGTDLPPDLPPDLAGDTGCLEECRVQNAFGTCTGQQRCGEPETCTAAVPAEEQCNGLDDNCDGVTDEGDLCGEDGLDCTRAVCAGPGGCIQEVQAGWCLIDAQCHRAGVQNPANACEVCIPGDQGGSWQPRTGPCDDGNPCTLDDRCQDGACIPGQNVCLCAQNQDCAIYEDDNRCNGTLTCDTTRVPHVCVVDPATVVSCDPSNDRPCLANRCDPATGTCAMTPVDEEGTCDDGDPCTRDDRCRQGSCQGTAYACDDGLACTADACDGTGGCTHELLPYFCRITNAPGSVVCVAQGENPEGDPCRSCDPRQDPEAWTFTNAPCDDGDPCTAGDVCVDGACLGNPYLCDDGLDCTAESCDGFGGCEVTLVEGFCVIAGACFRDGDLDPANPCLSCDPAANPREWTPNHLSCEDGNPCTTGEVCVGGSCRATGSRSCEDGNPCTDDWCDPAVPGGCVSQPNTRPCDDGNPCTVGDVCDQGSCMAGPIQACQCQDDADCPDDGDLCNGRPICYRGVYPYQCLIDPSTVVDCDGSQDTACRQNRCVPATGLCEPTPVRQGEVCDDGEACTAGDRCLDGTCTGTAYACDDLLDCTADACRGDGTCRHDLQAGFCLIAGTCMVAGTRDPDNPCQQCDPLTRPFTWTPLANGTPCNDQDACTSGDACRSGQCRGTAYGCDDGLSCTRDACLGDGTCRHDIVAGTCLIDGTCRADGEALDECRYCNAASFPDQWTVRVGSPCNDGNACTQDDRCQALTGLCAGTPYDCDDGLWCTRDACLGDGTCSHAIDPLACVIDDACQARGDRSPTSECLTCWPERSQTTWSPLPDGLPCSDNNQCTVNDHCVSGVCQVGPALNCNDDNPCTEDRCDPAVGCVNRPSDRLALDLETPGLFEFENSAPETGWHEAENPLGWPSRALYYGNPNTGTYETGSDRNSGEARTRDPVILHPGDPAFLSFDLWLDTEWSRWWDTLGEGRLWDADNLEVWAEFDDHSREILWASYWGWPQWWITNSMGQAIGPRAVRVRGIDLRNVLVGRGHPPFRLLFRFDTLDGTMNGFGGAVVDRVVIGQTCDDGDVCVEGESCVAGRCQGLPLDCRDGNDCVIRTCDPEMGCMTVGLAEDPIPCEDFDRCTEDSTCLPWAGWCQGGTAITCPDDQNECTADRCDSVKGCVHDPVPDYQVPCGENGSGVCIEGRCATWTSWQDGLRFVGDWVTTFQAGTWPEPSAPLSIVGAVDRRNGVRDDPIFPGILVGEGSAWTVDWRYWGMAFAAADRLAVGTRYHDVFGTWVPWTGTWVPGSGWSFSPEDNPPLNPPDSSVDALFDAALYWRDRQSYLMAGPGVVHGQAPYIQECAFDQANGTWGACNTLAAFELPDPACTTFQQMTPTTLWTNGWMALMGGAAIASNGQRYLSILVHDGSSPCATQAGFQSAFFARDPWGLGLMRRSDTEDLLAMGGTDYWNLWAAGSQGLLLKLDLGLGWRTIVPSGLAVSWDASHTVRSVLAEDGEVHFVGTWNDPVHGEIPFYLHATLDRATSNPVFDWRQDFPELAGLEAQFLDILRDPNTGDLVVVGSIHDSLTDVTIGLLMWFGAH